MKPAPNPVVSYLTCLCNRDMMPVAVRVALVVGTILFIINHGRAALSGTMSRDRWISAGLTYIIPYMVNIHGQFVSRS